MTNIVRKKIKKFSRDENGHFSILFAVSLLGVTISVGAAYDISQLHKAKKLAQIAADNLALSASIAVDLDNEDRYIEGQSYPYSELGGPNKDFTNSVTGSIVYNPMNNSDGSAFARATVIGNYTPVFAQLFGVNELPFSASADVAYAVREEKPSSIFFVTDNSTSMDWFDDTGYRKIDRLKTAMKNFMGVLEGVDDPEHIFRTALYGYNQGLDENTMIDPQWGTLSNEQIDSMVLAGYTESTEALERVNNYLPPEPSAHFTKNGTVDPNKFVIFMSDGANTGVEYTPVCKPGQTPEIWTYGEAYYGDQRYTFFSKPWWYDIPPWSAYGMHHEGNCDLESYSPHNVVSLEQCDLIKEQGTKIYSIAYDVVHEDAVLAEQFMKDCSSGEDEFYYYVEDGNELDAVYSQIADKIVKEDIRIIR